MIAGKEKAFDYSGMFAVNVQEINGIVMGACYQCKTPVQFDLNKPDMGISEKLQANIYTSKCKNGHLNLHMRLE